MPSTDQIHDAVERYAAACSAADKAAIVSCFAADAVFVDPYPMPANIGHEAIGAFWDGVFAMGKPISFVPDNLAACGDRAAFNFSVVIAAPDGGRLGIDGIEVATVNDDGVFSELTAYWDPANIRPLPAD
jgi:steroid delta-isomerase